MEITERITLAELTEAVWQVKSKKPWIQVTVKGRLVKDLRRIGGRYWFEYHCWESHKSADAQVWYRSHQQCTVLGFADSEEPGFTTIGERAEAGHCMCYRVRFDDGLEWIVFEDELLDSPDDFQRADPPQTPACDL
jgi:hypothetical protein